jgi:hypothetical protein
VKNLMLKIACVLAALLIWMQVAATTMLETDVALPLQVVGLGEGLTVAGSALPDHGQVRLRASKLRLMAHQYFGRSLGAVMIDLAGAQPGPPMLHELKEADVRTEAEVVMLLPPVRLPLRLDWEDRRRLPVRVPLRGELPSDRLLGGPVVTEPDSVEVIGPRRFLAGLDSLLTEPVELPGVQRTWQREVALVPPAAPVRTGTVVVQVSIPIVTISERVVANIPVIPLVESHLGEAGVSPPVCDVLVRGPADSIAALSPARLTVTVPVSGLEPGVHQVRGQVQHPAWVIAARLEPAVFTVLVDGAAADQSWR